MTNQTMYEYIQNFLSQKENPTVFELGVHWAEDTLRLMGWCNNWANYHGFEPDSRNIKVARKTLAENNVDIHLNHTAISRDIGTATLYLSDGVHKKSGNRMTGANSIRKPKEVVEKHRWIDFEGTEKVETTSIDAYCKERTSNFEL